MSINYLNHEGHEGSLWMGNMRSYMTEDFIREAFAALGETVTAVRNLTIKASTGGLGYCFVHFKDRQTALRVMHKLNGEDIPNTDPPIKFMLNKSNAGRTGQEPCQALWVGNLGLSDVADSALFACFASRYPSVSTARVIRDKMGSSRGYGFVRFDREDELQDALKNMNGFTGLCENPIKVNLSARKMERDGGYVLPEGGGGGPSQPWPGQPPYWGGYPGWPQHNWWQGAPQYNGPPGYQGYNPPSPYPGNAAAPAAAPTTPTPTPTPTPSTSATTQPAEAGKQEEDSQAEERLEPSDLESQELEFARGSEECWDAIEASRWPPVDSGLSPAAELFIRT